MSKENTFSIARLFAAPIEQVFAAWTDKQALETWMAPSGYRTEMLEFDLRVGGRIHYRQTDAEGHEQYGLWEIERIDVPHLLIQVTSFANAEGQATRHPAAELWPLKVRSRIEFAAQDGKTLLTLRAEPLEASEEEIALFAQSFGALENGWAGTLDQLDGYLTMQA